MIHTIPLLTSVCFPSDASSIGHVDDAASVGTKRFHEHLPNVKKQFVDLDWHAIYRDVYLCRVLFFIKSGRKESGD